MSTGVPRIVLGIVLTVLLGIWALRGLLVVLVGFATGGDSAILAGGVLGLVIAALLLVVVIRGLVLKGFAQRRAFLAAQTNAPGGFAG